MTVGLDINRRNLVAAMSAGGTLMACSGIAEAQDRMLKDWRAQQGSPDRNDKQDVGKETSVRPRLYLPKHSVS